ncbi:MAG: hypothetical protein ACI9VM_000169 [Candidatus Azotimanducaceae bacterium]
MNVNINPRIFGAFLVGAGLITASYFLAPASGTTQDQDSTLAVVAAPAPSRTYIEVADADNDGVPNWKESFRQVEPVLVTTKDETTESYAPPTTLTDQLAIELLADTVQAQTRGPFGKTQEDILKSASSRIAEVATDPLYTNSNITISSDNSREVLQAYGNRVAEILLIHDLPPDTRGEIEILEDAVYSEDPSILEELSPIIESYTGLRDDMLSANVPSAMTKQHLDLLNSYNALLIDIESMTQAEADPLYTMIRTKRYYDDAVGLTGAITNLYTKLHNLGVVWSGTDLVRFDPTAI